MTTIKEPNCVKRNCKFFIGGEQLPDSEVLQYKWVCPAYPNGIPNDILYGNNLHQSIQPNQVGNTVYEESTQQTD